MSLINCPECGKQISDAASACPHCGYPLSPAPAPQAPRTLRSTPLEEVKTNHSAGVALIVVALLLIPIIIYGFMFGIIPGILFLLVDIALFGAAMNNLQGTRKGTCPYCSGIITVTDLNASAMKCPQCKKQIAIKEDRLETLD